MNNIIDRQYYVIKSKEPDFDVSLDIDFTKGYDHITISNASIPKTYYILEEDCVLYVRVGDTEYYINILKGNYNVRSIISILNSKFSQILPFSLVMSYPNIYNSIDTGKFTFTSNINCMIKVDDYFLGRVLGLSTGIYHVCNNTLVSENVINLQPFDALLIKSNIVKNKENLLQEIFCSTTPFNSSIMFDNNDLLINAKLLQPLSTNNYHFSLQDINDNLVNLNGGEMVFVICIFKISKYEDMMRHWIEMKMLEKEKKEIDE